MVPPPWGSGSLLFRLEMSSVELSLSLRYTRHTIRNIGKQGTEIHLYE